MRDLPKICWDTSVMIGLCRADTEAKRKKAIASIMPLLERADYRLMVSMLIYPEILESKMLIPGAMEKFEATMRNRRMIGSVAVGYMVAKKAQEVRNRVKTKLPTPDAIHIATAIVIEAKMLHTFDKDMLRLSGKAEVENLLITECMIPRLPGSIFGL